MRSAAIAAGTLALGLVFGLAGGAAAAVAQTSVPTLSPATPPALGAPSGGAGSGGFGAEGSSTGVGEVTKLPIPRYVSLRSDEINVRRGPGLNYRLDWVYRRAGLPVKVIGEFGDWRQILDSDRSSGWVFHALLTGRRTVLVADKMVTLRAGPAEDDAVRARAEEGVVADLRQCQRDWCEIGAGDHAGWVPKTVLWGVDPGEIFPQ